MMRWLVGSSIKFRFLVVAGAAALIAIGILQLRDSPVDVFPEFAPPRVEIQTITLGLSASATEELVTVPLERGRPGPPTPGARGGGWVRVGGRGASSPGRGW